MERGTGFAPHRGAWVRYGPLMLEMHRWPLRLGVVAGRTFVGVLVGPFVVTVGRRRFLDDGRPKYTPMIWSITATTKTEP